MIGIIFGSSMGNTEEAASFLAENLGLENELLNVAYQRKFIFVKLY